MLPSDYQTFIHTSRYARWLPNEMRRETWEETVDRYMTFFNQHLEKNHSYNVPEGLAQELRNAIINLEVMPSMRCLMTAGKALEDHHIAGYNCSYVAVNHPRVLDEILYVLMCGTGVGFSVERQYIKKLPVVPDELIQIEDDVIVVEDSKMGWADAYRQLIETLYQGTIPSFDVSKVRAAGQRLNTFGGRASGPGPLLDLFEFTIQKFKGALGRRLRSIELHDIICKIGDIVVVGGVRRCLPKDTMVQTKGGFKKIQDICSGDYIITGGKPYKVLEKVSSGIQDLIRIVHRFGELTCTPNHRVAVFTSEGKYNFKEASELQVDDRLVWDSVGFDGVEQFLPNLEEKLHVNAKSINIPNKMEPDIAWLIGLIHGDGSVVEKGIEITAATHEEASLEKARDIFQEHFNVSGNISDGNGNCRRLRVNSTALSRWFNQHIKQSGQDIHIPEFILNASIQCRAAYLAGVFDADGRYREKDNVIEQCTTIYRSFSDDLVLLLSSLGIGVRPRFSSTEKRRKTGVNCSDFYSLYIVGNTNRIKWVELVQKYSMTEKLLNVNTLGKSPVDFSYPVSFISGNTNGYKPGGNILISSPLISNNIYYPTPIISIENADKDETFDIEVEDVHQFTTHGLVVHNSACLSLSNPSDARMRDAKTGQWWLTNPHRALANNSAAYTEVPDMEQFIKEWTALYESKSGERGIFNRSACQNQARKTGRRKWDVDFGCNPCSEIILRSAELCNLSEIVIRKDDTIDSLSRKAKLATILGTWQATLTNFVYVRDIWRQNCEEEALLGVSLTGIMDNEITSGKKGRADLIATLMTLKNVVNNTNESWARKLHISQSVSTTCVKPSGTVSQLVDCASGIHPRWAKYYIRTVRADNKDPLCIMMKEMGFPYEPALGKEENVTVFSFPIAAPDGCVTREHMTAVEGLELWLTYQNYYCEHKPSVTINVRENEWMEVGAWVYKNFDACSGVSFLPYCDHTYAQAPYQEINREEYQKLAAQMPQNIDWELLKKYEKEDTTKSSKTYACSGDHCELVDLT